MKKVYYLCAVLSAILLASCSNSNVTNEGPHALQQLTLTLSGGPISRSAITTAPVQGDEAKIHRVTIGIFGTDHKVKSIQTKDQANASTPLSGAVNFTVNNFVAIGDEVLVVCNAPTANAFAGVKTDGDFFKAATYDIVSTCNGDAVSGTVPKTPDVQLTTSLPMFGKGVIATDGAGGFKADITVNHSVAKVSIGNISVAFDANGAYANATFTPQEIFLLNASQTAYYNCDTNTSTFVASSAFLTGENAPASSTLATAAYIGTGATAISTTALSTAGTATFAAKSYFYTNPNTNTTPTKLIIKGSFVAYSGATAQTCYYPVIINHAQTGTTSGGSTFTPDVADSYVLAGKDYQISVTIKSIGNITNNPNTNITPASLAVTLTVSNFTPVTQNVVFN